MELNKVPPTAAIAVHLYENLMVPPPVIPGHYYNIEKVSIYSFVSFLILFFLFPFYASLKMKDKFLKGTMHLTPRDRYSEFVVTQIRLSAKLFGHSRTNELNSMRY